MYLILVELCGIVVRIDPPPPLTPVVCRDGDPPLFAELVPGPVVLFVNNPRLQTVQSKFPGRPILQALGCSPLPFTPGFVCVGLVSTKAGKFASHFRREDMKFRTAAWGEK